MRTLGRRRQPSGINVLSQLNAALLVAQLAFLVGRAAPWKLLAGRIHFGRAVQPPAVQRIPSVELLRKCRDALSNAGLEVGACNIVAKSLVAAQRDGRTAHGLGRLNAMVDSVASGEVFGQAKPTLAMCAPAVLRVDAHTGFVHPAIALGVKPLVARAREHGVAILSVVNCRGIIGSLWCLHTALSLCTRMQPCVHQAAAPCAPGCSPMCTRLQPHVHQAAALCDSGCSPMCTRLQPCDAGTSSRPSLRSMACSSSAAATRPPSSPRWW